MQDQRSRLDSKRAEMQSTLEQATAAALEYRQVAEALKAKVDNSRQGWEQAINELKRQLEGVLNEVTGLSLHRARLDKSVEELNSFEGKVLNCDRVTTNMAKEIRQIGLKLRMPKNGCMVWKQWWKATRLLFPSLSIGYTTWSTPLFRQHPQGKLERRRCSQRR